MRKISMVILALAMSANLAACGGSEAASTTAAPTTAASTTAAPTTAAPTTAASNTAAPETAAQEEVTTYTLNYSDIASWVDAGFIGTDESGAPVVMAIDAANKNAVIIFGDNSDMTAVSFLGEIAYDGDLATITDVANDLSLTFGVTQIAEDTIELDMGEEIGKSTIKAADKDKVLEAIKMAIDNYEHIM